MEEAAPLAVPESRTRPVLIWTPCLIATAFLLLAILFLARSIALSRQLAASHAVLAAWQWQLSDRAQHQVLNDLRFVLMDARDPAYAAAKVAVSWNPHLHEGMIATESLPAPAAGRDYQLWVLDPHEETPVNGGVIQLGPAAQHFSVPALQTDLPGFAVSIEPAGGSASPTGPILLAVAPPP